MTSRNSVIAGMSDLRFYCVMAVLMSIEVMSALETVMIYTALPTITREFHDPHMTGWLVTGFLLVQAGTAAIGGRLGDIFGRRKVLAIILVCCVIGSWISAIASNLEMIILGRAVQGLSGAIMPLCYGIARQMTVPNRVPFWIGVLTGAMAFSGGMGYIVAGYLADIGSWRYIFWFTMIYGLLTIPMLLLFVPEYRNPIASRKLDIFGGLLFVPAIALLLYGITLGAKLSWLASETGLFVASGVGLLIFWAWYECRREDPLIDVRLLKRREIFLGNLGWFFNGIGMTQLPLVLMMIMQQPLSTGVGLGISAALAGVLKLPSNATSLVAAPLSGFISGRFGSRWAVLLGGVAGAIGWTYLMFFHGSVWEVVFGSVIAFFGSAVLSAALPNLVLEGAPLERSGEVTGLSAAVRAIGAAVGAQIVLTILALMRVSLPGSGATYPSQSGYQLAFAYIAFTAACIAVVSLFARKTAMNEQQSPKPAASSPQRS